MDRHLFASAPAGRAPAAVFDSGWPSGPASATDAAPAAQVPGRVRRVLALVDLTARGQVVIRHAREIALGHEAELMVVHVIDTRTTVEPDGPCGWLVAAERFSRRVPRAAERLELALARSDAAWAESAVLCGDTDHELSDLLARWQPDVVAADAAGARRLAIRRSAEALRRAGRLVVVDRRIVPAHTVAANTNPTTKIDSRENRMSENGGRMRQAVQTALLGLSVLILYLLLFANEATILDLSARGGWYFVLPVAIAFGFSFVHGAFTARFWDVLGVKASGKKG
jgi:hypothetical protein